MGESGDKSHPVQRLYWANARDDVTDKQIEEQIRRFCSFITDQFQYNICPDSDTEILCRKIKEKPDWKSINHLIPVELGNTLELPEVPFVVAILPEEHPLAVSAKTSAKAKEKSAPYGVSNFVWSSLAYGPPGTVLHTLLHEMLHLVGADDCYDSEDHRQTCTFPNCIMQYNPCNADYKEPFLCDKSMAEIGKWVKSARGN